MKDIVRKVRAAVNKRNIERQPMFSSIHVWSTVTFEV